MGLTKLQALLRIASTKKDFVNILKEAGIRMSYNTLNKYLSKDGAFTDDMYQKLVHTLISSENSIVREYVDDISDIYNIINDLADNGVLKKKYPDEMTFEEETEVMDRLGIEREFDLSDPKDRKDYAKHVLGATDEPQQPEPQQTESEQPKQSTSDFSFDFDFDIPTQATTPEPQPQTPPSAPTFDTIGTQADPSADQQADDFLASVLGQPTDQPVTNNPSSDSFDKIDPNVQDTFDIDNVKI